MVKKVINLKHQLSVYGLTSTYFLGLLRRRADSLNIFSCETERGFIMDHPRIVTTDLRGEKEVRDVLKKKHPKVDILIITLSEEIGFTDP